MCGFAAFFEKNREFSSGFLQQIDQDIYHRGPDSGASYIEEGCALVFRRLAILDPTSKADQPMYDESGRYVLVFNGEIYNYPELKNTLEDKGFSFQTGSDTEAILKGFLVWGPDVVQKLEGMYTFVVWDKQEKIAHVFRDPLGIKPLYIARKGSAVGFASEMRPLRRLVGTEIDADALAEIMVMRFPTERRSNLKNIEMIPGGTYIRYNLLDNTITEKVFENVLDSFQEDSSITYEDALQITEESVVESVKRHLQSDVGYSVQLSGGVDSSLVTAIAAENSNKTISTYGIRLEDERHDESPYRQMVIEKYNTDHHEILLTGKDFTNELADTCSSLESPTAHLGCVFLKHLSKEISKQHKVTLVGEGADEFFGGYDRYSKINHTKQSALISKLPSSILDSIQPLENKLRYKTLDPALVLQTHHDHNVAMKIFPELSYSIGTEKRIAHIKDLRNRIAAADQLSYLGSLLLRQDKISMAHSIETRTPFAHMPLARAVNKIPVKYRIPGDTTKPLLKKVAEKWLPHDLLYRRKVGLTLPIFDWMNDDSMLKPMAMALTDSNCAIAQYAEPAKLKKFVEDYYAGRVTKPTHVKILPILMITNLWLEGLKDEKIESVLKAA